MKSTMFGKVVAGAVAGLFLSGAAMANDAKKAAAPNKKGADTKAKAAGEGYCKSNECKASVHGAKNECSGKVACKGITEAACIKDGKGTWETGPKPE